MLDQRETLEMKVETSLNTVAAGDTGGKPGRSGFDLLTKPSVQKAPVQKQPCLSAPTRRGLIWVWLLPSALLHRTSCLLWSRLKASLMVVLAPGLDLPGPGDPGLGGDADPSG